MGKLKVWYSGWIPEERMPDPSIINWTNGNCLQFKEGPEISDFVNRIEQVPAQGTLVLITSPNSLNGSASIVGKRPDLKFATVGKRAVYELQKLGIPKQQIVAQGDTLKRLVESNQFQSIHPERIIYPSTTLKTGPVAELNGFQVELYKTYQTLIGSLTLPSLEYNVLIFGSPSGVEAIKNGSTRFKAPIPRIIALGPTTEEKLREDFIGLPVFVAKQPDIELVIQELLEENT